MINVILFREAKNKKMIHVLSQVKLKSYILLYNDFRKYIFNVIIF